MPHIPFIRSDTHNPEAFKKHRANAVAALKALIEWAQYTEKSLGQSETEGVNFILISTLQERATGFVYEAGMTNGAMMAQYDPQKPCQKEPSLPPEKPPSTPSPTSGQKSSPLT